MSKGATYTVEIAVVKLKKGVPSVITVDGKRYVLDPNGK